MEDPIPPHIDGISLGYQQRVTSDSYRSLRVRTCKRCKYSTTDARDFLQHQISAHTELETHPCDKCHFETTNYLDLVRHRRLEHRRSSSSSNTMDGLTGVFDEANNNEKFSSRDKLPSPMLPPGGYDNNQQKGPYKKFCPDDGAGDAIEVFECGLCSFATTKPSDLKAHQIKHRIGHQKVFEGIYRDVPRDVRLEVDSDFEIMKRSYSELARNDMKHHDMSRDDDEDNRLVIDENLPKTMMVSRPPVPMPRPVPVYSRPPPPVVHQRAKPGPKPGTTGSSVRPRTGCAPVREAVDPAKYITIQEPDGIKYACSKCGNIYKWRKSLNKHWKEKHDGEIPDPRPNLTALNIPRLGKGYVTGLPNGKGNVISFMGPQGQQQQHPQQIQHQPRNGRPTAPTKQVAPPLSFMPGGESSEIRKVLKRPVAEGFGMGSTKGMGMPHSTMAKSGSMMKYASPGSLQAGMPTMQPHKMSRTSDDGSLPRFIPGSSSSGSPATYAKYRSPIPPVKLEQSQGSYQRSSSSSVNVISLQKPISFTKHLGSPKPAHGEGILDLSRRSPEVFHPPIKMTDVPPELDQVPLQDEPLDFSMKPKSESTPYTETDSFGYVSEEIGSLSLQCPSCAYAAHNKQDYDQHMELHLRKQHHKCVECQDVFVTMDALNDHFLHGHPDVIQQKLLTIGKGGAINQTKPQESTQLYKYLTMDSQNQLLSCMVCGAIFQWQWTLSKHFEQDHQTLPNPKKKKVPTATLR